MTNCTPVQNLMTPFIEGKLGPDDEKVVWHHIDSCKTCMADYQQSLFLTHLLRENMTLPEPPEGMGRSIKGAVARPDSKPGVAVAAPAAAEAAPVRRRRSKAV